MLKVLNDLFTAFAVVILIVVIIDFYRGFKAATGATVFAKILSGAKGSITILWNQLVIVAGALMAFAVGLAGIINDPQITSAVQGVANAHVMPWVMLGIAIVTVVARFRSL